MVNIWEVIFANLVAENAECKAELQRLVNDTNTSVANTSVLVGKALRELVISDAKVSKWQEMRPDKPETETNDDGEG